MKFNNCNQSGRNLVRMNAYGTTAIWWCEQCCKDKEPELYNNHIEDGGKLLADLKEICNG